MQVTQREGAAAFDGISLMMSSSQVTVPKEESGEASVVGCGKVSTAQDDEGENSQRPGLAPSHETPSEQADW